MPPVNSNAFSFRNVCLVFSFFALTVIVFFNSLGNDFVFDDTHYIKENYLIKALDLPGLWNIFSSFYVWDYLPLTFVSFGIDYGLFGLDPAGYHLTNLLLHFVNSYLTYRLVFHITQSGKIALWTAIIFLTHPIQVESVSWISERKNLLSFAFFAGSFICYLRGDSRKLSLVLFGMACLSKSSVVILPLLLIIYDISFNEKKIMNALVDKVPYFLISLVSAALTLLSHSTGETIKEHSDQNPLFTFFSMLAVLKEYILKIFLPVNLNVWYPSQIYKSFYEPQVMISAIVMTVYFVLLWWGYKNKRIVFFGLAWFLIALLPNSQIVPMEIIMADRFLYIPLVGFSIALGSMIRGSRKKEGLLIVSVLVLICLLSVNRNSVFKNDFLLWKDSVARNPNNTFSLMFYGVSHWEKGDHDHALESLKQAKIIEPANEKAALYSAHIYKEKKEWNKAEALYKELARKHPKNAKYLNHLAVFWDKRGKTKKSIETINQAIKLDPELGLAHFNRGVFLNKVGDSKGALDSFKKAVVLEQNWAHAHHTLGMFYIKRTDRPEFGIRHLNQSLRLDPDQPQAEKIQQTLFSILFKKPKYPN
ncbi:MAG: tetratricopeptide repeat protein [Nitrospinota bacterium]